jgi:hypothetical protein
VGDLNVVRDCFFTDFRFAEKRKKEEEKLKRAGEETRVICCYLETSVMHKVPNNSSEGQ